MPTKPTYAELKYELDQLAHALKDAERRALPEFMAVRGFTSGRNAERWYVGRIEAGRSRIMLLAMASNEASASSLVDRLSGGAR